LACFTIPFHNLLSLHFSLQFLTVYELMSTNIVQPDRPQMTVRSMRIA
jgi:hypothetical protein